MVDNRENRLRFSKYLEVEAGKLKSFIRYQDVRLDLPTRLTNMDSLIKLRVDVSILESLAAFNKTISNYE